MENITGEFKPENAEAGKEGWDERVEKLRSKLSLIRKKGSLEEHIAINERITAFGNDLRKRHGKDEVRKCVMFHVLIGSSGYDDIVKFFDFPGDDSVEEFIERLEEEQEKEGKIKGEE